MELVEIKNEINKQLGDKETFNALLVTTFKGLAAENVKRAVLEGMLRGFTLKDFLERNVYAIPFNNSKTGKQEYSLVTSIDYARKVGMRSGICGKLAPVYAENEKHEIVSCTVTVKRKVHEHIGEYTATVFFKEYNTSKQQWATKPHTMIAKVAEMHALRMACPEELSQVYVEEEREQDIIQVENIVDVSAYEAKLNACKNLAELQKVWADMPVEGKNKLEALKNQLKVKLTPPTQNANA